MSPVRRPALRRTFRASRKDAPGKSTPAPYAVYRLAIKLQPGAVGAVFSLSHPRLRIEVTNRMEVGSDMLLLEGRIFGPGAATSKAEWEAEIAKVSGVTEAIVRPEAPYSATYRLTQRTGAIHDVFRRHRVLTRYPLVVQNGWMRVEIVVTAEQIRAILADLRERVGPSRVEAVRRGPMPLGSLGLSPAQELVFRAAMAGGYFDLPRGVTVTGLAGRLGLSKSAVSETLTRVEKRLAEAALQLSLL